jgi:hypothetical protein
MSIQDQYTNTVHQSQEAWAGIVESLTDNVQAFTTSAGPVPTIDPNAAIDQVFDFWSKTLDTQRGVLKQFADASVAVGEQARSRVEQVGAAVREQGEYAKNAVRKHAEATKRAGHEQERAERDQAFSTYDDLTKAELQDELSSRGLAKTGNIDELRNRLVADDLK